jgi:hypothetical protein
MKWTNLFLILIVVAVIVGISGCTNYSNSTKPNTTNTSQQTQPVAVPIVNNSTFENNYIKFTIPTNITVQDKSNDTALDVELIQGEKSIGSVHSVKNSHEFINDLISQSNNTTVAGKKAYEHSDPAIIQSYIPVGKNQSDEIDIMIQFDPSYIPYYDLIKDSLVIKKAPTQ